jgi:AcrR family transcriptional regulator
VNPVALKPRRAPSQQRSSHTVETILEAAARVLEDAGPAGFNTNAVARRAGVSVGSLYQYFPGKQALVAELSRRQARDLQAALSEAAERGRDEPLAQALRRLAGAAIDWQTRRPALARNLDRFEETLTLDTDARGTTGVIRDQLARVFQSRWPEAPPSAIVIAADDCLAIARGLIDAAVARGPVDARLKAGMVAAFIGYLSAAELQ